MTVSLQDPEYRRFGSTVDIDLAVKHYGHWKDRMDGLRRRLEELNQEKRKEASLFLKLNIQNRATSTKKDTRRLKHFQLAPH